MRRLGRRGGRAPRFSPLALRPGLSAGLLFSNIPRTPPRGNEKDLLSCWRKTENGQPVLAWPPALPPSFHGAIIAHPGYKISYKSKFLLQNHIVIFNKFNRNILYIFYIVSFLRTCGKRGAAAPRSVLYSGWMPRSAKAGSALRSLHNV